MRIYSICHISNTFISVNVWKLVILQSFAIKYHISFMILEDVVDENVR